MGGWVGLIDRFAPGSVVESTAFGAGREMGELACSVIEVDGQGNTRPDRPRSIRNGMQFGVLLWSSVHCVFPISAGC